MDVGEDVFCVPGQVGELVVDEQQGVRANLLQGAEDQNWAATGCLPIRGTQSAHLGGLHCPHVERHGTSYKPSSHFSKRLRLHLGTYLGEVATIFILYVRHVKPGYRSSACILGRKLCLKTDTQMYIQVRV
ncbi:hypothetical protein FKM82_011009 [Ascaphus truei]